MNKTFEVCNIEYDNTLNKRLNERYFPNQTLQPNLEQTKFYKISEISIYFS